MTKAFAGIATITRVIFLGARTMSLDAKHRRWLENRKLNPELALKYGIKSVSAVHGGRLRRGIEVPYIEHGKVITRKVRWLDDREPSWTHPHGGKRLWNVDVIRDPQYKNFPIIVTEGEWDALAAIQAGYPRTVSVPAGAKSKFDMEPDLEPHILNTRTVVICGDNDEPGQGMIEETARRFGKERCHTIVYPQGCKDLNDILKNHGIEYLTVALKKTKHVPLAGVYTYSDYPDKERPELFSTGWPVLNPHIKLQRGEFMVVTGIPGAGKSRVMLDMLAALNRQYKHRSLICSFEMPIKPYVRDVFHEHYWERGISELTDEEKARADIWIGQSFYFLDHLPGTEAPNQSLEGIIERAELSVFRHGVDWFLLDPWNQIEHAREKFESDLLYQERAIRMLKKFARTYNCGVIVVAHPTKAIVDKAGKKRMPTLYDVSGSAHWANAADHGVIVWRENEASQRTVIRCDKSRFRECGLPGEAHLMLSRGRFRDAEPPKASKPIFTGDSTDDEDSPWN